MILTKDDLKKKEKVARKKCRFKMKQLNTSFSIVIWLDRCGEFFLLL